MIATLLPRRLPVLTRSTLTLALACLAGLPACFPDLTGAPCDGDRQCPSWQTCSLNRCVDGPRPTRSAALTATGSLGTVAASLNQPLVLTVNVQNSGNVELLSVAPTGLTPTGTAMEQVTAGPTPASVAKLAPGATASFVWSLQPVTVGALALSVSVQGAAVDDPEEKPTATAVVNPITIQRPPVLEATSFSGPAFVSRGQTFTASLVVANRGDATASGVTPSMPGVTRTGGAQVSIGAAPAAQDISGGQSATFEWTLTENGTGPGTVRLSATAGGRDANTGATISTATQGRTEDVVVQTPAALSISSFALPTTIARGSMFSAVMVVTNTGQATASMVLPAPDPPTKTPTGGADGQTSTVQAGLTIPGGEARSFTWSYTEIGDGPGTLELAAGASGVDANSGQPVTAASTATNVATVQ